MTGHVVFATSGACSSHGGVDCSYQSVDGDAICNDGWNSSVPYTLMIECRASSQCTRPITKECSENYMAGLATQALENGSAQSAPDLVAGQEQVCLNQNAEYHSELNAYNSCIGRLSSPKIYPSIPQPINNVIYQTNQILPTVDEARTSCMKWQIMNGYVADGICCSKEKGVISAYVKEFPTMCTNLSRGSYIKSKNISKTDEKVQLAHGLFTSPITDTDFTSAKPTPAVPEATPPQVTHKSFLIRFFDFIRNLF